MPYNPDGSFTLTQGFGTGDSPDNQFPARVGNSLDDIAAGIAISSITSQSLFTSTVTTIVTSNITNKAGLTQTDMISGVITTPQAKDYRLIELAAYGLTLTKFTAKLSAGTLTAALTINTTPVTNGSINATSTQGSVTPSAANVMSQNNTLILTLSSISSAADLSFTIWFTRTLAA